MENIYLQELIKTDNIEDILLIKDFLRGKDNAEDLKEAIQLIADLVKKSYCLGQEHSKKNITIYKKEN